MSVDKDVVRLAQLGYLRPILDPLPLPLPDTDELVRRRQWLRPELVVVLGFVLAAGGLVAAALVAQ